MDEVTATLISTPTAVRRPRATLIAVSMALFCIQVDFFGLNLAIPDMARSFGASTDDVQWVISAYMLALGSLFILGGRLGDIYGRRSGLLAGIAIFGAASVLCALAPNLEALVAYRILAGMGAALIFPLGIAVVANEFDDAARAKALGLTFAIANVGTAVGPFVGGGLAEGPGWRWIFWALVPLCVISFVITYTAVRNTREPGISRRLDWEGAALLIAGVATLSFVVDLGDTWGWASPASVGMFVAAALLLGGFLWTESRAHSPLLDLSLFRNPPYVLVMSLGAISNIGYVSLVFVTTLYLQGVRNLSALLAGVAFLAPATMVALSGPIGARLKPYFRPGVIMAGSGVVGAVAMFGLTFASSWYAFIPLLAIAGFGFGLGWTFANMATQDVVDPNRAGEASGVLLTVLVSIGGIGLAIVATAVASLQRSGHSQQDAYFGPLRVVAVAIVAWTAIVMVVRAALVRRGVMAPLSMKAAWPPVDNHLTTPAPGVATTIRVGARQ
jgi:EmrB/QacA subfamily drug resistance transporter